MSTITSEDTVLFVDDEISMLQTIRRGLLDEPYSSKYAGNAEEALKILEQHPIAVLVTDLKMPGMNGLELLNIVQQNHPDITRIVLTGYYQVSTILNAINKGHIHRYLTKPWKMNEEFIPTIHQAIEYHHMIIERKNLIKELTEHNEDLKQKNKEILLLKEMAETSDENKTKILNHITKTIIPYMTDIIQHAETLRAESSMNHQQTGEDLNKRGLEILELLRKLEKLLQKK